MGEGRGGGVFEMGAADFGGAATDEQMHAAEKGHRCGWWKRGGDGGVGGEGTATPEF